MTVADVLFRYEYGWWANKKLFAVISRLSTEEFTRDVAGSYGSIRNTLVHTMSAEWGWLERCGGEKRGPKLEGSAYPTLDSVSDQWAKVEGHVRAFLAGLKDADLRRSIEFQFPGGPKQQSTMEEMLLHAANHAVHHRGQVSMIVRMLGRAPGDVDLMLYYGDLKGVRVW